MEGTYYDRALYVFACGDAGCRRQNGSVRAIRSIRRDEEMEAAEKKREEDEKAAEEKEKEDRKEKIAQMSKDIFDNSQESEGNNAFETANPFAAADPFAKKPAKEDTTANNEKDDEKTPTTTTTFAETSAKVKKDQVFPAYPSYYITVEEEVIGPTKPDPLMEKANVEVLEGGADDNSTEGGESSRGNSQQKELINAIEGASMDELFQKFIKTVDHNPEQVLRYERPLEPLLYNSDDSVAKILKSGAIPKSDNGSERKVELQVMPHAIMVLEEYQEIIDGMEWGTIIVATAENDEIESLDSNGVGYSEEWVGVQWEEPTNSKE